MELVDQLSIEPSRVRSGKQQALPAERVLEKSKQSRLKDWPTQHSQSVGFSQLRASSSHLAHEQAGCLSQMDHGRCNRLAKRIASSSIPRQISLLGLLQLLLMLLIINVILDTQTVCAMSKRFLKGFIMGAMFAHHHKP